jgi:hypothetical protein
VVTAVGHRTVLDAVKIVEKMDRQAFGNIDDIESFRKALRLVAERSEDGTRRNGQ